MRTTPSRLSKWRNSWQDSISYPRSRWTNPFTHWATSSAHLLHEGYRVGWWRCRAELRCPRRRWSGLRPQSKQLLESQGKVKVFTERQKNSPQAWLVYSFLHPFIHSSQIVESQPWARPCAGCKHAAVRSWDTAPPSRGAHQLRTCRPCGVGRAPFPLWAEPDHPQAPLQAVASAHLRPSPILQQLSC